jgi:hypothetical protein
MIKRFFCIALALVMHVSAFACEYNVRDVGFVDLEVSPYQLYVFIDESTDAAQRELIDDSLFMGLLDANISATLVEVGSDHEALELIKEHVPDAYPAGVLVSPKGFHQAIPLAASVNAGSEAFEAQLQTLASSEFRTALLEKVTQHYGVVFIIEGPNAEENVAVTEAATRSVRKIHTRMKMLPKAISNPPVVMTLTKEQFEDEALLLWSYGLKPSTVDKAHVVILYGRGRQMGPVLIEDAITEERLTSYLQVIGADCECGLDRSWMQGTMIPLLWSAEIQDEVSVSLGFDPENPRTKMEISMTVAKGQTNRVNGGSDTKNPDSVDKLSFAYSEDAVTFMEEGEDPPLVLSDGEAEIEELSDSLYDGDASRATGDEGGDVVAAVDADAEIPIPWSIIIGALVAAVIIIVSLAVMIGAFKRE